MIVKSGTIGIVSPRYRRGNVLDYFKLNQKIDPSAVVWIELLVVLMPSNPVLRFKASLMEYHTCMRVGSFMGISNVWVITHHRPRSACIDDNPFSPMLWWVKGIPKLIEVGIAQVVEVYAARLDYATSAITSSLRWSAPEILVGKPKTEKSDVYAFANTYIEVSSFNILMFSNPSTRRYTLDNYIKASLRWFYRYPSLATG